MSAGLDTVEVGTAVAERAYPPFTREDLRRYAEASGDFNPLHLDTEFARQAGFDDVIVHGMLGMALLGRLVTETFPDYRLQLFRARFRNVVAMGEPIRCTARLESWRDGVALLTLAAADVAGVALIEGTATLAVAPHN
jgi:acyl dehydratase